MPDYITCKPFYEPPQWSGEHGQNRSRPRIQRFEQFFSSRKLGFVVIFEIKVRVSGCEKRTTSVHDAIAVNFPHISLLLAQPEHSRRRFAFD
jgi:hypothetical protein